MSIKLVGFEKRLTQAVMAFWHGRTQATARQQATGKLDQGNRGAVTGGKNLDAFRDMIVDVVHKYGPDGVSVHRGKTMVVLPGFFRPTKQWNLLVVHEERLLAALELKSLCGPSFGNNANNRCEEALGNALDFRKAQSEGLFGRAAAPFLGYFILVEDAPQSRATVASKSPHFPTDEIFQRSSYLHRMQILCERMMEQVLYTSAAVLTAPIDTTLTGQWEDLSAQTSFRLMLARLAGHLASEAVSISSKERSSRIKEEPDDDASRIPSFLEGEFFQSLDDSENGKS